MEPKFFNMAGPIQSDIHYSIDPLMRIDTNEIMMLVRQKKYFALHAPFSLLKIQKQVLLFCKLPLSLRLFMV